MTEQQPCQEFTPPRDGLYSAYCARCGYSRRAHEKWDQWTVEVEDEQ